MLRKEFYERQQYKLISLQQHVSIVRIATWMLAPVCLWWCTNSLQNCFRANTQRKRVRSTTECNTVPHHQHEAGFKTAQSCKLSCAPLASQNSRHDAKNWAWSMFACTCKRLCKCLLVADNRHVLWSQTTGPGLLKPHKRHFRLNSCVEKKTYWPFLINLNSLL